MKIVKYVDPIQCAIEINILILEMVAVTAGILYSYYSDQTKILSRPPNYQPPFPQYLNCTLLIRVWDECVKIRAPVQCISVDVSAMGIFYRAVQKL